MITLLLPPIIQIIKSNIIKVELIKLLIIKYIPNFSNLAYASPIVLETDNFPGNTLNGIY